MIAPRHCWWCGLAAEVDTDLPESAGMLRDGDDSWICANSNACSIRAMDNEAAGIRRNQGAPLRDRITWRALRPRSVMYLITMRFRRRKARNNDERT